MNIPIRSNSDTVHDGYKDHKCYSCGKSFSQVGNLKTHIQTIHEGHKGRKY